MGNHSLHNHCLTPPSICPMTCPSSPYIVHTTCHPPFPHSGKLVGGTPNLYLKAHACPHLLLLGAELLLFYATRHLKTDQDRRSQSFDSESSVIATLNPRHLHLSIHSVSYYRLKVARHWDRDLLAPSPSASGSQSFRRTCPDPADCRIHVQTWDNWKICINQ